jgi:hypothetical protein
MELEGEMAWTSHSFVFGVTFLIFPCVKHYTIHTWSLPRYKIDIVLISRLERKVSMEG